MPQPPGDQIASLLYLGGLILLIGGGFVASRRMRLSQMVQSAAIWVFIFLGAILAVGIWDDVRDTVAPRQSVALDGGEIRTPQQSNGHFYLTLGINDTPVRFVVDTGASDLVLRLDDAQRAGIDPDTLIFSGRAFTANGVIETAPIQLDRVSLGGVTDTGVRAVVNPAPMPESLLGMGYLQRFSSIEITGGELILTR